MYLILDNKNTIMEITPHIVYAKMQENGIAIVTDSCNATSVYSSASDHFYSMSTTYAGEPLFHAVEVTEIPSGVCVGMWAYNGKKFVQASNKQQICIFRKQLDETDYKIIKCSECQMLGEKLPYDIVALHKERQILRQAINEKEESGK